MPTKKSPAAPSLSTPAKSDPALGDFMASLDHPLKSEIEAVRRIVLGASPDIAEGIKWNSVSFRTTDWFATVHLRSRDSVQLIFHTGAKVKASATTGLDVADPAGLLKWLSKDRALVALGAGKEFESRRAAFGALVKEWIGAM